MIKIYSMLPFSFYRLNFWSTNLTVNCKFDKTIPYSSSILETTSSWISISLFFFSAFVMVLLQTNSNLAVKLLEKNISDAILVFIPVKRKIITWIWHQISKIFTDELCQKTFYKNSNYKFASTTNAVT